MTTLRARDTVSDWEEPMLDLFPDGSFPDPPRLPDMQRHKHIVNAGSILADYFHDSPNTLVSGKGYLVWHIPPPGQRAPGDRRRSPLKGAVVPDCVVAFGVDPATIEGRNGYDIVDVGKPPDFVLEVASMWTGKRDYTVKLERYQDLAVLEYWQFDHTGGLYHDAPMSGYRLVDGVYQPIPITKVGDDLRGYSEALGLELRWESGHLRFFDRKTGEYLPNLTESKRQTALERAGREAERLRADAEQRRAETERQRADAERRRADAAEAELRRLRGE